MLEDSRQYFGRLKFKIIMRKILRYWRDLPKETKQSLMTERIIKAITFSDIVKIYEANVKVLK
jgi:hypothetical protein